jgi:hypothetical protein
MTEPSTPLPPLDDLMEVTTPWGRMQLWKARAMCLAYTQTAIADAAVSHDDQPQIASAARGRRGLSTGSACDDGAGDDGQL